MHTHRHTHSCQSALFWHYDMKIILETCKFEYFHEFEPPAKVYENNSHILLSNTHIPWQIFCDDKALPHRESGKRYAIISKDSLCRCTIVTRSHVIPPRLSDCLIPKFNMQVAYPFNAAVIYSLHDSIKNLSLDMNYYATFSTEINYGPPHLTTVKLSNDDEILYTNPKQPVGLQRVIDMIKSNHKTFLPGNDRLKDESSFDHWFDNDKIAYGITFLMSITGIICAIITFIFCYRQGKIGSILGTLLTTQSIPLVEASDGMDKVETDMRYRRYLLTAGISTYLVYKLVKFIYKHHIYLELTSSKEKILIYVTTVQASVLNIILNGNTQALSLNVNTFCLHTTATIEWSDGSYGIHNAEPTFQLPKIVQVLIYRKHKLLRILASPYMSRILLLNDVYYAVSPLRVYTNENECNETTDSLNWKTYIVTTLELL